MLIIQKYFDENFDRYWVTCNSVIDLNFSSSVKEYVKNRCICLWAHMLKKKVYLKGNWIRRGEDRIWIPRRLFRGFSIRHCFLLSLLTLWFLDVYLRRKMNGKYERKENWNGENWERLEFIWVPQPMVATSHDTWHKTHIATCPLCFFSVRVLMEFTNQPPNLKIIKLFIYWKCTFFSCEMLKLRPLIILSVAKINDKTCVISYNVNKTVKVIVIVAELFSKKSN